MSLPHGRLDTRVNSVPETTPTSSMAAMVPAVKGTRRRSMNPSLSPMGLRLTGDSTRVWGGASTSSSMLTSIVVHARVRTTGIVRRERTNADAPVR